MAVFFGMPDDDAKELLAQAMRDWHPTLHRLGVKVQIIMAASDNDTPAVKHDGHAALASIRIVSLKDRLTKQFDAEMLVSRADYEEMSEARRLSMFDHELSHIDPVKKEVKQRKGYKGPEQYYVPLDDLGRPKLKLKLGDWSAGDGFRAVVARHGDNAIEFENLRRAYEFARKARDEGPQADDQGGETTGTVDRDDIGTQLTLPFDEVDERQEYHDDKSHVPAGERHGNSPTEDAVRERLVDICDQIPVIDEDPTPTYEMGRPREEAAPIPTWRKMPLSETGWEDSIDPELWTAIGRTCFFAGELADELVKGETFGSRLVDVEVVLALVEQISEGDERPIKFESEEAAEALLGASEAEADGIVHCDKCKATYDATGRERCPSCSKPCAVAEPLIAGIALVIRIENANNVIKKLTKAGIRTVGELCAWVDRVAAEDGGMADRNGVGLFSALRSLKVPERSASMAGDAVLSFLKANGLDPRVKSSHGARVQLPDPRPAEPAGPEVIPPATKLAALDGFPDAVADLLAPGVTTVETLLERTAEHTALVPDMPLRNKLVAYLVSAGAKLKPAEYAADAVADHVTPKPVELTGYRVGTLEAALHYGLHRFQGARTRWPERVESGLSDAALKEAIGYEFGTEGGGSGADMKGYSIKGGKAPSFTWNTDAGDGKETTLNGSALVRKVREVMGVPLASHTGDKITPAATNGKPAKKPAGKKRKAVGK